MKFNSLLLYCDGIKFHCIKKGEKKRAAIREWRWKAEKRDSYKKGEAEKPASKRWDGKCCIHITPLEINHFKMLCSTLIFSESS